MDNKEKGNIKMNKAKEKLNRELMGKVALAERYLSATDLDVMNEVLNGEHTIENLSEVLGLPQYAIRKSLGRINKFVKIHTSEEGTYFVDMRSISDVVMVATIAFSAYIGVIAILF